MMKKGIEVIFPWIMFIFFLFMPHLSLDAFAVGFAAATGARIELD